MDINTAKSRISELTAILEKANRDYYVASAPTISDYDFDMLMKELESLEAEYPQFKSPDSPTQHVGSDTSKGFRQYRHKYPMLSLGNTYNIGEIDDFVARATKALNGGEGRISTDGETGRLFSYSCELKFDGTAICLTYKEGKLYRALTRGDGTVGDDVTANVKHIKNIPQKLTKPTGNYMMWPDEFEIRGEIYMPFEAFDRLNKDREEQELPPFANPRNAASGSLKLQDSSMVAERGLECTLYHMLGENLPFATHDEALETARSWGLPVSDKRKICRSIDEIEAYIQGWDDERHYLPFATDGIVIKINQLDLQNELGYTSKFPRWAVAYKFQAEKALTKVLSIDYQVGRTGAVTPVANMEPVPLSGTIVKRATLHNEEQMNLLDIRIGDSVYVEKGGEIIPKITAVELDQRPVNAIRPVFPTVCPVCGTPLVKDEDEARWFCPNSNGCPPQIQGRLVHFLSRKAMNVLAGDATIEQLYSLNLVKTPADFYNLTKNQLLTLDGWKERSAARFLESLDKSRQVPFERVLYALGIRYVGEQTAKSIARHFGNIDDLMKANRDALLEIEDVGEVIADSVVNFFSIPANVAEIASLREAGLQLSQESIEEKKTSDMLAGKTIVISGNFSISRDEMKRLIELNGGKNSGSISGKTAYLLAGEKAGPEKLKKAESLGTPIINEAQFRAMIEDSIEKDTQSPIEKGTQSTIEEGTQLTLF